jgi:hypothetical protein
MKLSKRDIGVTIAVCLASAFFLWLFWKDLNSTAVRNGGKPLGSIVFRKRSATRRSPTGLNWERLQNNFPVFEGDTIRTADFSEAAIHFDDGTTLDLSDNSMIKLNYLGTEEIMDFREGSITLTGGSGRKITAGGRTVTFSEDARVSFSREGDEISIGVEGGTATVTGTDGASETITENNELVMNAETGEYTVVQRPLLPRNPPQNARYVTWGSAAVSVPFSWQSAPGTAAATGVLLELSRTGDFAVYESFPAGEAASLAVLREPGVWFWRLKSGENGSNISQTRRFSLMAESPVKLILPAEQASFQYRKIPPAIPFSWGSSANATGYILEVAAEPEFRTPILRTRTQLTSLRVNALDEGTWYWRVIPVVQAEPIGTPWNGEVRRIRIVKKDEMLPLVLTTPTDGNLFQTQVMEGRGLPFSWEPHPEAVGYELAVADNSGLNNPRVLLSPDKTFLFAGRSNARALEKPGVWYWSVRWKDEEGNFSPWSSVRKMQGIDGKVAIKLTFPPDGYLIADSLSGNTRFAWKSNVPARTVFLVAQDMAFQELLYSETVQTETMLGQEWKPGTYFWRLRTFNNDGTVFLETPPRGFSVKEPFPGPRLYTPIPGRVLIYQEGGEPQFLTWEKIDGVDHYGVRIFPEGSETPVYQRSLVTDTRLELPVNDMPNGSYRIKIQGFAIEKPGATRLIGLIGEASFTLRKISPVELTSPVNGAQYEGLSAFRQGIVLEWTGKDIPESPLLTVSKSADMGNPVFKKQGAGQNELIRRMPPGEYYWTVTGSVEGFDVSARQPRRFVVRPIPPLPPPALVIPEDRTVFNADFFRTQRTLTFAWEPVAGATHYALAFYKGREKEPLFVTPPLVKPEYLLEDLSVLERGEIRWAVWAEGRDSEGFVEQPGKEGDRRFTVDIPEMKSPDVKTGEVYYGR